MEEKVYDLLWGAQDQRHDEFRLVHYSLQRIATDARINIKTVRELIPRLIEKGFIRIEHEADVRRNIPTLYRVFGHSAILQDQRRRGRFHVAKTGKGVFYAHPVSATLDALPSIHPELAATPMGLSVKPGQPTPRGPQGEFTGPGGESTGVPGSTPMGYGVPKPLGGSGFPSLDLYLEKLVRQTPSSVIDELNASIKAALGVDADPGLLLAMIHSCHQNAIETARDPATEEELLYFTATKSRALAKSTNIRNHLAVLRKAVPECFSGETFRAYRAAAEVQRQRAVEEGQALERERRIRDRQVAEGEARQALWAAISQRHQDERGYDLQAIEEDPELDELGKRQAAAMRERLGRYTRFGL